MCSWILVFISLRFISEILGSRSNLPNTSLLLCWIYLTLYDLLSFPSKERPGGPPRQGCLLRPLRDFSRGHASAPGASGTPRGLKVFSLKRWRCIFCCFKKSTSFSLSHQNILQTWRPTAVAPKAYRFPASRMPRTLSWSGQLFLGLSVGVNSTSIKWLKKAIDRQTLVFERCVEGIYCC